jgi:hypothetical protein
MDPLHRVVTQIPLSELWTIRGPFAATRVRSVGPSDLAVDLHSRPILRKTRFVVADVGRPLEWLDPIGIVAFLRDHIPGRIVDPSAPGFRLNDFPGQFCFVVSEWAEQDSDSPIYVFERHH